MIFSDDKLFSKEWFKNYFLILQGAIMTSAGYIFFLIPHKIIPGGIFGFSSIIYHLFGFPAGTLTMLLNIPLILIGMKIIGPKFGGKTVVGILFVSACTDIMNYFWKDFPLSDDPLVSSLIGGFLVGSGIALIFKAKATTGGTDIIGQILYKKLKIPIGNVYIAFDATVITVGAILIQGFHQEVYKVMIYSIVSSYATAKILDIALEGYSYYKGIFIISDKYEEVKEKILTDLKRGGTMIPGKGMYNDSEKKIIFSALSRREIAYIKDYMKTIDAQAFIVVFNTQEILGKGFSPVKE